MVWAECQAINVLFRVTDERKSERRTRARHGTGSGERKEGRKLRVRCEIKKERRRERKKASFDTVPPVQRVTTLRARAGLAVGPCHKS